MKDKKIQKIMIIILVIFTQLINYIIPIIQKLQICAKIIQNNI